MSLQEQINNDLKTAMRARAEKKLLVLRMLSASLKNKRIDMGKTAELSEDDVIAVVKSEVKKRKDSIVSYEQGNRQDLVDIEKEEIEIIEKYMPEQMSDDELSKIVEETATQLKVSGMGDFGKLMGAVMGKTKGQADGNQVSVIVKKILS